MGKNKLSSGLINVVTYDTNSNISLNSGSNLLMSLSGSGTVTIPGNLVVLGGISGSTAESASYSLNADKIDNLDSTQLVLTSSFNSYTSSASSSLGSLSGSIATTTLNLSSSVSSSIGDLSGSIATTTLNLSSSVSSSIGSLSGSIATTTSGLSSSIGSLSSSVATTTSGLSSSVGSLSSSVATTTSGLSSSIGSLSSSVATNTSGLAGRIGTIEGNYATTGSNIFVGSQVITGSLYITNDMVVQGCSCLQNITASAVSIGTNTVVLNTATPAVRFAGISVQDSGSNAGVTGSIFWDGLCNRWIYSNPSTVGYTGGMLLSGPRNTTGTIGNESTLTCNYLAKSGGGDHLYDSCIQEVSGSVTIGGTLCSSGVICAPTVITTNVNVNTSTSTGANLIVNGYSDFWNATNTLLRIQHNGCASTIQSYTGGATGIISLNPDGGNVGIGCSSLNYHLEVRCAASTSSCYLVAMFARSTGAADGVGDIIAFGANGVSSIAGMYRSGGGSWGLELQTANQNTRMRIDNSGISCFSCQVCVPNILISNCATIGTVGFSYPEFRLAVTPIMTVVGSGGTSTGEGIYFKRTSDLCQGGWISGNGGALYIIGQNKHSTAFGDIYFATNNGTTTCDIMVISGANQRVGIGTPTPVDKFEVVGGIHTSGTASNSKSCTGYLDYYVGQVRLGITGPNTTTPAIFRIDQYSSNASVFRTPFYISAGGNVGIGTNSPADLGATNTTLTINGYGGNAGILNLQYNGTNGMFLYSDVSGTTQYESRNLYMRFGTNNTERMRITCGGEVGIGTCSPCALLHVNGTSAMIPPVGTTAERPTASTGMMRYNSTFNLMEFYNGTSWVQMGSGDLATAQCINNTSMCHSVYQAAGTSGLIGQGSGCISLYGAAAPSMATSNTGYQFGTHGGHCGVSEYPGYWAVHLGGARAVNQLKVWIHSNSWGYFELQGSNNSGNASGFNQSGNWTTLSFLCSNNSNCQNMGGNASGCADGTVFSFWYTNNVTFSAYRIKVLDSSKQMCPLGNFYGGSAGYVWQLNRV